MHPGRWGGGPPFDSDLEPSLDDEGGKSGHIIRPGVLGHIQSDRLKGYVSAHANAHRHRSPRLDAAAPPDRAQGQSSTHLRRPSSFAWVWAWKGVPPLFRINQRGRPFQFDDDVSGSRCVRPVRPSMRSMCTYFMRAARVRNARARLCATIELQKHTQNLSLTY